MQEVDETLFCKKYLSVLKAKRNYSKNRQDWYNTKKFNNNQEVKKSDSESATKKTETDTSPSTSNFICSRLSWY